MEMIKVNMSPNPLDVQTIHASQNDSEAREWGFELHNNGDVIDSSEITDQMVFKAYEGGTEQLLPENTSTPTTSPFKGDIRYPQGLLSDQEFLYRESPAEEDGLAKITDIKGNTLVWNQLVPISTRATTTTNGITFTNNDDGSAKASGTALETAIFNFANANAINIKSGHKYLLKGCPSGGGDSTYQMSLRASNGTTIIGNDVGNGILFTASNDYTNCALYLRVASGATISGTYIPQLFDLTQMGLDSITDPAEFTSLFPLSYYSYNQGSLLSFNGNGIKTVGKNLFDEQIELGTIGANGNNAVASNRWRSKNYVPCFPNTRYVFSKNGVLQTANFQFYDADKNCLYNGMGGSAITTPSNAHYLRFFYDSAINVSSGLQLEFGSSASSYEPYTSSTLSLPISTYFPNGMKSAGSVYDELTPTKGITRIGAVDLGSLEWSYNSTYGMYSTGISNSVKKPSASSVRANAISSVGTFTDWATFYASGTSSGLWAINTSGYIGIATTETNSTTFKNSLQGVYLYYELATSTETSFTTASLVTENAEIPLSNDDGVLIGKCTEQLSENPGFIDAKIKLSDSDGTCYSNKLQLHVERSPQ